jgi:hypothetical protein
VNPLGCLVDYLTPINFIGTSLTPTDTSELIPKDIQKDISEFFERYKKALSKGN